jgi:hypothetical protein
MFNALADPSMENSIHRILNIRNRRFRYEDVEDQMWKEKNIKDLVDAAEQEVILTLSDILRYHY